MATASQATGYIPPGATAAPANPGTGTATTFRTTARTKTDTYWAAATATGPASPIVPPRADDHDYINTYLGIHQLSNPSNRYLYTLWFVFLGFLLVGAIAHQSRWSGGIIGATWRKYSIRRLVWKRNKRSKRIDPATGKRTKRSLPFAFPSNSQVLCVFLLFAITMIFCFVGADYIFPKAKLFDYRTSFISRTPPSPPASLAKLARRADVSVVLTPAYTIDKAWWTAGARTGLVSFALFPLAVLFALKSPPFAIFSVSFLTHVFYDSLVLMHKWAGRLVWFVTALHVALWSVQLFKDDRSDGSKRTIWEVVWIYDKFIWGVVSFVAMTLMTVLSLQPVRKRFYEFFYITHVILVPVTLITAALHFPLQWWWPAAAGAVWVLERGWRFIRYAYYNGWAGGLGNGERHTRATREKPSDEKDGGGYYKKSDYAGTVDEPRPESWEMEHVKGAGMGGGGGKGGEGVGEILDSYNYISPISPTAPKPFDDRSPTSSDFGSRTRRSTEIDPYAAGGCVQPYDRNADRAGEGNTHYLNESPDHQPSSSTQRYPFPSSKPTPPRANSTFSLYSQAPLPLSARPINAPIPAGYALAQLLPSRMVRLTLRLPKPFKWHAGQNVLLQIREISIFTSHPFSIVSVHDVDVEQEIVLLVKARKGFTLDLWKETKKRMDEPTSSSVGPRVPGMERRQSYYFASSSKKLSTAKPVFFRALVDGPYGSSARVQWGHHSSVLIVCGGSGVSFGVAILTWVAECMASRDREGGAGKGGAGKGGRNFITRRARFVWIVREFAEVLWVSNLIRRCMELVPSDQLVVDIFVTNYAQSDKSVYLPNTTLSSDELAPPKPMFAKDSRRRSESSNSISSEMSVDSDTDLAYLSDASVGGRVARGGQGGNGHLTADGVDNRDSVLELTNWDEDEDELEDERAPAELKLSQSVKKQGRLARAKSRKRAQAKLYSNGKEPYATSEGHQHPPLPRARTPSSTALNSTASTFINPPRNLSSPSPSYTAPLHDDSQSHSLYPASDPSDSIDNNHSASRPAFGNGPGHAHRNSIAESLNTAESSEPLTSHAAFHANPYNLQNNRFDSYRSTASGSLTPRTDSMYDAGSTRGLVGGAWDAASGMFTRTDAEGEDKELFLDDADEEDLNVVAEMARPGRPKLEKIIKEEVELAEGMIAIASCGPASLNATVRNVASSLMKPMSASKNGGAGVIGEIYTEEYGY